ncbi:MAG: family 43 glycosylhydrolase [Pyrinomonadaceae bacterium]|nr:family 43 glycosylhydrolase [Sphingobacteriaceae bacterium]
MKLTFIFLLFFISLSVRAQNPICPIGTYIADPTARVWPDGKLYIYGSTDESPNTWCSYKHDVLFTNNMRSWSIVTDIFSSRGLKDSFPQGDPLLFAPDAMYKNGKYYMYFCTPDRKMAEGVAVSNSPLGPFGNAKLLNLGKFPQIDPTILIDDDGQAYYYWGQNTMKGAKLKPDLTEIDTATIQDHLLTQSEHFFHEGSFVFKRKGVYYAVFADESRRDRRPTCLGYATSNSPMGPFKYRGVIIDNYGCDPESWNNHGSVAEYKGQWYVFYHRSSQASKMMRRACVEPISFNADGTINEVEMTTQGASAPLSAFANIEAERACWLSGYCRIKPRTGGNEVISDIKSGDKAAFKYLNFGKGATKFKALASSQTGGRIIIHEGSASGKVLGSLAIKPPKAGEINEYKEYTCPIAKTQGVKALWLEFKGTEEGVRLFNIDAISFE